MRQLLRRLLPGLLAAVLLVGCGQNAAPAVSSGSTSGSQSASSSVSSSSSEEEAPAYVDVTPVEEVDLEDEAVALIGRPRRSVHHASPVASGTLVKKNNKAEIDYSNTKDGYVMVRFVAATDKRLKVQVKGPTTTYTYNLTPGQSWTTFPLSDGNGTYKVVVYENTSGTKYATVLSQEMSVTLTDEFAPFLRPNQYVNYENAPKTIAKAQELAGGTTDPLKKVEPSTTTWSRT